MLYTLEEVELTLTLYPIAKIHIRELTIIRQMKNEELEQCEENYKNYYSFIIRVVDDWLRKLFPDELQIVTLRIFKRMSYDTISIQLGYANHSSIVRKYKDILNKISKFETVQSHE